MSYDFTHLDTKKELVPLLCEEDDLLDVTAIVISIPTSSKGIRSGGGRNESRCFSPKSESSEGVVLCNNLQIELCLCNRRREGYRV